MLGLNSCVLYLLLEGKFQRSFSSNQLFQFPGHKPLQYFTQFIHNVLNFFSLNKLGAIKTLTGKGEKEDARKK